MELGEVEEVLRDCFFVLKNSEALKKDKGAVTALTVLDGCCKDLVEAIIDMGRALAKDGEIRDNLCEPFAIIPRGKKNDSQSN